jgi:transposase InsO family protein
MDFKLQPLWKDRPLLNKYDRWRQQAKLLKLSKKACLKLEWFIYYYTTGKESAATTARYFGTTRKTFYKWFAVFDPTNLRALEEGSRAPINTRKKQLTRTEEDNILGLRKQNPEFGKMKIRRLYQRKFGQTISSWKIQLVIEKYRLQRRPKKSDRHFKKQSISKRKTIELKKQQKPGFLVAFDSIELHRNGVRRYIVTGIDTVSKIAWARMYTTHTSATAKDLFLRLYAVVQGNILNVCQDNGSEFEKYFAELMASLNIPQYFSRVHTPKDNPVCERFNRTLKEEFLRQGNWTSNTQEFNQRLTQWLIKYNTIRPHQSLNYLTPFEYHFNTALVTDVSV